MEQSTAFVAFILSLKLRHFKAHELAEPPRELWRNYVGVLTVADQAREELGFSLSISKRGSYRDPETNRKAGGGKRSRHQIAEALDLSPPGAGRRQYEKISKLHALLDGWRREGRIFALPKYLGNGTTKDRNGERLFSGECDRWYAATDGQEPCAFRFRGGLGLYSWGCHVDTRGRNATWRGTSGSG